MVDGADAEVWSDVAAEWAQLWDDFASPAHEALIRAGGVRAGSRVLDVGCGAGGFVRLLHALRVTAYGVDPAAGMREVAAAAGLEASEGDAEHLPFPDDSFDVVTAVNVLQFADDTTAALREFTRVLRPGGRIAVAGWAEGDRNDITLIENAIAAVDDDDPLPEGPLRAEGGFEAAFAAAGLDLAASGIVQVPWRAPDDETLVRGILLGEDHATLARLRPTVLAAAAAFRDDRGYLLQNAFRWAVGRV